MSEYQYYEFQAIDRPLTPKEMHQLRSYSSRARITPTSFVNEYSWGRFKGDENAWMEKYFDAFLYLANWGTHIVMLRLPTSLLDLKTARQYCGESASAREKNGKTILTFASENEGGEEWVEGEGELSSFISVRSELARGDLRALYLAWLLCVQNGELDDAKIEPEVPAGLSELSASLRAFADFLRIDQDLIDAAAVASPSLVETQLRPVEIRQWLAKLPVAEKDDVLARLMMNYDPALVNQLGQRMMRDRSTHDGATPRQAKRRTVAALLRAGKEAADQRERIAAEKTVREKAARERAAARARVEHLDQLTGKEPMLWAKVESLIATKQPKKYNEAVELLADLRDLAVRKDDMDFRDHVDALRAAHGGKRTLIERLDRAGL